MIRLAFLGLLAILFGCTGNKNENIQDVKKYESDINAWHAKRMADLVSPSGWVNLVGLFWLEPGTHSFGSSDQNDVIFPKGTAPEKSGFFLVQNGQVTITVEKGVEILADGKPITTGQIFHPDSVKNPVLTLGSLRWNVIQRGDKLGIRLRDLTSPALKDFKGVERYSVDFAWKLEARFEKYDSLKTIPITNIIGQTNEQHSPGSIVFEWKGQELRLDALEGRDDFFIVFADATSGHDTYGGGRFINVAKPDAAGKTIIDFNKAYNPPCVFSPYATCPLPPPQNRLPIEVKAGELNYHYDDHSTTTLRY